MSAKKHDGANRTRAEFLSDLRAEIDAQAETMTNVATGKFEIDSCDPEYAERRKRIRQLLLALGLEDPNPFRSLWNWYGEWSQNLPTYQSRRDFVADLYEPLHQILDNLEAQADLGSALPFGEYRSARINEQIQVLNVRLQTARSPEDYQAVGLLCRDIMISLAEQHYDSSLDGGSAGRSAVQQLYAVVEHHADGSSNQALRKLLKATIDFANTVQHRRAGTLQEAGLVAEATVSAVRVVERLTSSEVETDEPDGSTGAA